MMRKRNKGSRFLASALTVLIGALMTASLIFSAGAIAPDFSVSNYGTTPGTTANDVPVTSLTAGQVWTGKSVTELERAAGSFNVTLSALGGAQGASSLVTSDGLVFNDAYDANYGFVMSGDNIPFYLDGVASATEAVPQGGGVYTASGAGWSVAFDTVAGTVVYKVTALKTMTTPISAEPSADAFNSLRFGVILKDSAAEAKSYVTNPPNCTVTFTTTQTNSSYAESSNTAQYVNTKEKREYVPTYIGVGALLDEAEGGTIATDFIKIKLDKKYDFKASDGQIGFDLAIRNDDDGKGNYYLIWINGGDYMLAGDELVFGTSADRYELKYYVNNPPTVQPITLRTDNIPLYKWVTVKQFDVTTPPTGDNTTAVVQVGSTTYQGTIGTIGTSWSFTMGNSVVTLVDADTLTVTTTTGQLVTTTTPVPGSHTHNAYGTVTLIANQGVAGDVTKEPEKGVAGDVVVLPRTDGISSTTLLGIFGLALIAVGGTSFLIYRKKFLN